jgi:hypothetical protein
MLLATLGAVTGVQAAGRQRELWGFSGFFITNKWYSYPPRRQEEPSNFILTPHIFSAIVNNTYYYVTLYINTITD